MKITVIMLALLSVASIAAAQELQSPPPPVTKQTLAVTTISVPTIQCSMCVKTISKALAAVDGVASAEVDLDEKTTTVRYDATKTDVKKLERAIADAGYDANATKRDPKAYEKLSPCCKMDN